MLRRLALALVLSSSLLVPSPTHADSLARPIVGTTVGELWPLEIEAEIVKLADDAREPASKDATVMPSQSVVVPDGRVVSLQRAIMTPSGRRLFALELTARHHPAGEVELEWALEVEEARYRPLSWSGYLLHRLQLGTSPELGPQVLKIARADIVSTSGDPVVDVVAIDGEDYEIRLFARSLRR
jgi:hypothetical protein